MQPLDIHEVATRKDPAVVDEETASEMVAVEQRDQVLQSTRALWTLPSKTHIANELKVEVRKRELAPSAIPQVFKSLTSN